MHDATQDLLNAFDGHDVEAVRAALDAGADACSPVEGKTPVEHLLTQYWRSDRLPQCLQMLIEHGATLDDPYLIPVLLDDGGAVRDMAGNDPKIVKHRTSLVSAFTALEDVTLLHVAAEYGNLNAARALIEAGADANAAAGVDDCGMNGHTPLFHTVNSNANRSAPIMRLLVEAGADVRVRLNGLWWGKGYEWETLFFDVSPISFAQMGLMPQVHRDERDIFANIEYLQSASGGLFPTLHNVPNRYLRAK